jgi:ABC-type multidrug transport system fused ATPase/permease subunit
VVVGGVAGGLRSWLFQGAAERVMYRLRTGLFATLMAQEVGFYDRVRTGGVLRVLRGWCTGLRVEGCRGQGLPLASLAVCAALFHTPCRPSPPLYTRRAHQTPSPSPATKPSTKTQGELTNRLAEDTRLLKGVATTAVSQALRSLAVTTLGLVMM